MARSKAKNKYYKDRTKTNWAYYKKIRQECVKLVRKTKKDYFSSININFVADCKNFWTTIKPHFGDKSLKQNKIIFVDDDHIISNNKDVAQILNNYFVNITDSLNLPENEPLKNNHERQNGDRDDISEIIEKIQGSFKH